jgi:sialidase-1
MRSIFSLISLAVLLFTCGPGRTVTDNIQLKQFNYPVLKGKEDAPVLRVEVISNNETDTCSSIEVTLMDTPVKYVESVTVYFTGKDSLFRDRDYIFGTGQPADNDITIKGRRALDPGSNFFWVCYQLSDEIDLLARADAGIGCVEVNAQRLAPKEISPDGDLRVGVKVRHHMDDQVHTYRIPGLATTNKGTLLAIYDVRRESARDLQGHMDIGVSRSADGGHTWEPMRIAMDMGVWGGLPEKFNGVSDACILVDENSDDIFLAGLWMHGVINTAGQWVESLTEDSTIWNHQWRNRGSQPGFGVRETSQFLVVKSVDDGRTWSEPVNLTEMCKKPEWWLWAPAPGRGITLNDGTLVFPTQGRDENGLPFSNITYSKDGGNTWSTSNPATHNTTENQVVQLSDGSLMLNIRDNRNRKEKGDQNGRAVAVSNDLGNTWTRHPTSNKALIEPVCMAALHRHVYSDQHGNQQSLLLFSNPNSKYHRKKMTVKVSFDDGETWPEAYWIELDEGVSRGYSCLTSVDNDRIGILYEGSQAHMTFQVLGLEELLSPEE